VRKRADIEKILFESVDVKSQLAFGEAPVEAVVEYDGDALRDAEWDV
jgi:hypothetical protein